MNLIIFTPVYTNFFLRPDRTCTDSFGCGFQAQWSDQGKKAEFAFVLFTFWLIWEIRWKVLHYLLQPEYRIIASTLHVKSATVSVSWCFYLLLCLQTLAIETFCILLPEMLKDLNVKPKAKVLTVAWCFHGFEHVLISSNFHQLSFFHLRVDDKPALLLHLLRNVVKPQEQTVVFAATKHHVEYLKEVRQQCSLNLWEC